MKNCRWLCFLVALGVLCFQDRASCEPLLGRPKKRIAVADFKTKLAVKEPGSESFGPFLAEQLRKALKASGRCLVLEAADASLLLTSDVTEWGVRHFPMDAPIHQETVRCVLKLRLIDSLTGRTLIAEPATGEVPVSDEDAKSRAGRQAVLRAAALIEKRLNSLPWYGHIVKTEEDGTLFVDTGLDDGRGVGQEFDVVRPGERLFNPNTGEAVGMQKTPVGRIRLVAILGRRLARAEALDGSSPHVGDIIE